MNQGFNFMFNSLWTVFLPSKAEIKLCYNYYIMFIPHREYEGLLLERTIGEMYEQTRRSL